MGFARSRDLDSLAPLGTACPDHVPRTKVRPLVVPFEGDLDAELPALAALAGSYRADHAAYHARCRHPNSPALRDANAAVWLLPGLSLITFAADKTTARVGSAR